MFEKMGLSLAESGQYDVHIMGYPGKSQHGHNDIHFHASKKFKRLSLYRLVVPFISLSKATKLNPSVVIITTHELLFFAWMLKLLKGTKIIYDVQENYMRNIFFLSTFPIFIRPFLALYVRVKEILHTPFISHFILSDYGYRDELTFMQKKSIVIENKVKRSSIIKSSGTPEKNSVRLLFSGTLAESTGVFTAVELATQLHAVNSNVSLKIIGYCAQSNVLRQIKTVIEPLDFVQLEGGDQLVPHHRIMEVIGHSHFGIISYPPNPSTRNTMPTKLYEYLGSHLPILLINYRLWVDRCQPYPAAITFDPDRYEPGTILQQMLATQFYITHPEVDVFWENEAEKLFKALKSV